MTDLNAIIPSNLVFAMLIGGITVLVTCAIHYQILHKLQMEVSGKFTKKPFLKMLVLTTVLFCAHTIEVWLYTLVFLGLNYLDMGSLQGAMLTDTWPDYLYFSTASYTTLGVGDIYPTGAMRLITGIEAVNGLMLIAWSATYLYFHIEKRWLGLEK